MGGWRAGDGSMALAIAVMVRMYVCMSAQWSSNALPYTTHQEVNNKTFPTILKVNRQIYTLTHQLQGKPNDGPIGAILTELRVSSV
jgi:hypothetical protein